MALTSLLFQDRRREQTHGPRGPYQRPESQKGQLDRTPQQYQFVEGSYLFGDGYWGYAPATPESTQRVEEGLRIPTIRFWQRVWTRAQFPRFSRLLLPSQAHIRRPVTSKGTEAPGCGIWGQTLFFRIVFFFLHDPGKYAVDVASQDARASFNDEATVQISQGTELLMHWLRSKNNRSENATARKQYRA